jgi:hypothetical protein
MKDDKNNKRKSERNSLNYMDTKKEGNSEWIGCKVIPTEKESISQILQNFPSFPKIRIPFSYMILHSKICTLRENFPSLNRQGQERKLAMNFLT